MMLRFARLSAACALVFLVAACAQRVPQTGPYPRFAEFAGDEVKRVEFVGELAVPEDSLRGLLSTRPSRCRILFLPFCVGRYGRERHTLDLTELARDVTRIQLYHRDHGYYGTRVVPDVEPVGENDVAVRFAVLTGELVRARTVEVEGTEGIAPAEEVERRLPLKEGEPFRRSDFLASADSVQAALLREGYAYAQVLRNYSIDTIADVATARFGAVPGPLVRVDTILVLGTDRLSRQTIERTLAFRQGDVLVASRLAQSQRNLYDLGLVSFASVQLAPDSLQVDPDSARATVVVRVVEAPRYLGEASAGYGTLDCVRTQGRLVDRNFLGGARRLELNGSLSKIGTAAPLDGGLEGNLCKELQRDTLFKDTLNYRVAATFTQPRLFGTRTSTTLGLHVEKLSEINAYLRTSRGGQLAVAREVAPQTLVTTTFNVERGRTNAQDIFFCVALLVCDAGRIDTLRESRWSNSLGVALNRDRTRYNVYPVGGYHARATTDWASALLGSDDRYLRVFVDGAAYREVRRGWVLAGRLMGGTFLESLFEKEGFIPPERRFYAGGPNTVRGLERNALGPTVYVTEDTLRPGDEAFEGYDEKEVDIAATGGKRMVVGSLELRMPSPVFTSNLRFAAFVDAGQVWASERVALRGDTLPVTGAFRATPGVGVRLLSPVGPIRLDMGYNPHGYSEGPLFGFEKGTGELELLERKYRRSDTFWDRLQFYFAVGQAF